MSVSQLIKELQNYLNCDYCLFEDSISPYPAFIEYFIDEEDNLVLTAEDGGDYVFTVQDLISVLTKINGDYRVILSTRNEKDIIGDFIRYEKFIIKKISMLELKCGCLSYSGECCNLTLCPSICKDEYTSEDCDTPIVSHSVTVAVISPEKVNHKDLK